MKNWTQKKMISYNLLLFNYMGIFTKALERKQLDAKNFAHYADDSAIKIICRKMKNIHVSHTKFKVLEEI